MERLGFQGRFPIIDFYLHAAADYPIYGYVQEGFRMLDVGKVDSLTQATAFVRELDREAAFCDSGEKCIHL
jgi:NDP-sugar pyrophosphorylase family protein